MTLDAEVAKLQEIVGTVDIPFKSKSLDVEGDGTLILRGLAATFGVDRFSEKFDPATFRTAWAKYMETNPLVVLNHSLANVFGKITEANISAKGVEVVAEIPKPDAGQSELVNAYNLIKEGVLKAFSVGGRWKRRPGNGGVVYPVEIVETSIAGVPVDPASLFEVVGVKALGSLDDELARLTNLTPSLDDALAQLAGL